MRYGRLDRRVTIQRMTRAQSSSGDPIETWATLAEVWASYAPARGDERFVGPQLAAKETAEFQVRWSERVRDLSAIDRLLYDGVVYDISAVHEIGRREGLRIIAWRRAD